jgi:hypothetical protein
MINFLVTILEDCKNAHLHALDGAEERLSMYRADVLDYKSLRSAFSLCDGVFHVASPVSNDPVSLHMDLFNFNLFQLEATYKC